jgi:uncharacterized protein YgfB (UPF0149 family)
LRDRTVEEAAIAFNAMLEGLANAELRGDVLGVLPRGHEEAAWQSALETVVRGFTKQSRTYRKPRSRVSATRAGGGP